MLKWHCGQDMFCKQCGRVHDCTRAVEFDLHADGKLYRSYLMCAECWDKQKLALWDLVAQSSGKFSAEVQDGRQLFARAKRTSRTSRKIEVRS
jgi:hypothetical protein